MTQDGKALTRTAILKAAAKIFAAKGFRAATVRDICAEAGANISLVSRYFGSKSGLYAEVCRSLFDGLAAPLAELDAGVRTAVEWQDAIRKWIVLAIGLTSDMEGGGRNITGIFRQEMFAPSPMHGYLREKFMMPVFNCLKRLVEAGGSSSEAQTLAHLTRIWSQILFFALSDETWQNLFRPAGVSRAEWIPLVSDDIVNDVFLKLHYSKG